MGAATLAARRWSPAERPGSALAIVRRLAAEGARVAAADLDLAAAQRIPATGAAGVGEVFPVGVDVSDEDSVRAMVAVVADRFGGIDTLFNNAAATGSDMTRRDGSCSIWTSRSGIRRWRSTCGA